MQRLPQPAHIPRHRSIRGLRVAPHHHRPWLAGGQRARNLQRAGRRRRADGWQRQRVRCMCACKRAYLCARPTSHRRWNSPCMASREAGSRVQSLRGRRWPGSRLACTFTQGAIASARCTPRSRSGSGWEVAAMAARRRLGRSAVAAVGEDRCGLGEAARGGDGGGGGGLQQHAQPERPTQIKSPQQRADCRPAMPCIEPSTQGGCSPVRAEPAAVPWHGGMMKEVRGGGVLSRCTTAPAGCCRPPATAAAAEGRCAAGTACCWPASSAGRLARGGCDSWPAAIASRFCPAAASAVAGCCCSCCCCCWLPSSSSVKSITSARGCCCC